MGKSLTLYNTFKEIFFYIDNGDRQLLEGYNLSVSRYYALKHIGENPGISFTNLSALMLNDKSNISRLVKNLEEEGLVVRKRHQTDRRTLSLYLTEAGEKRYREALKAHDTFIQLRFSNLDLDVDNLLRDLAYLRITLENSENGKYT